eukprot:SAG31_NODE_6651_length_1937_cov_1.539173_2_plen_85_part_00
MLIPAGIQIAHFWRRSTTPPEVPTRPIRAPHVDSRPPQNVDDGGTAHRETARRRRAGTCAFHDRRAAGSDAGRAADDLRHTFIR